MEEKRFEFCYREYGSEAELEERDRMLVEAARRATVGSYSPYSHFKVGAAVRLENGETVTGANQENMAYPSGLCAERVALFGAGASFPGVGVEALAIVAVNEKGEEVEASPCGACRQVMSEQELRQGRRLRVMVALGGGKIRVVEGVNCLLPFGFSAELG